MLKVYWCFRCVYWSFRCFVIRVFVKKYGVYLGVLCKRCVWVFLFFFGWGFEEIL